MRSAIVLLPFAVMFLPPLAAAQEAPQANRHPRGDRHGIEIGANIVGRTSTAGVQIGGATVTTGAGSGIGGTLAYSYWLTDQLSFQVSASVVGMSADVSISGGTLNNQAASVVPLLFGVKVQPFALHSTDALRPFVALGAGTVIGTSQQVTVGAATLIQSRTETVFGGRLSAGVDLLLGRRFTLDVGAGYRLAADFTQPIGGDTNYSGAEFNVLFGILLGRGR